MIGIGLPWPARVHAGAVLAAVSARIQWWQLRAPRLLRWLLADPRRMLALGWLVAMLMVGTSHAAYADDPIIGTPDLAHGGPKTLFETYGVFDYKVTVKPDSNNSGGLGFEESLLQTVGAVVDIVLWLGLGILFGALALLEWFLGLTIYRDSAGEIDSAVRMISNHVFWPMLAATVAVGAFLVYARWRGEGAGFASDLGWVVAAAVLGIVFASGPSTIMGAIDDLRQTLGNGVVAGAADYLHTAANPIGFPTPPIGGTAQEVATRTLTDGMWNSYGATFWCFVEFHDLSICKVAGFHAMANDSTWQGWMQVLDNNGAVPEFQGEGDWIRGQDLGRMGMALMLLAIVLPLAFLLGKLIVSGLIAVVGVPLMLIIGLVFLVFWPIPGILRQIGTKFWTYTIGLEMQALVVTVTVSGDMVVSAIITTQTGKYGFFLVGVLNIVLMVAAVKAQAWLEMLTTVGGGSSMGLGSFLVARALGRGAMGMAGRLMGGVRSAMGRAATGAGNALDGTIRGSASLKSESFGWNHGVRWKKGSGPLDMPRGPKPRPPLASLDGGPGRRPLRPGPAGPLWTENDVTTMRPASPAGSRTWVSGREGTIRGPVPAGRWTTPGRPTDRRVTPGARDVRAGRGVVVDSPTASGARSAGRLVPLSKATPPVRRSLGAGSGTAPSRPQQPRKGGS
ncbi:hypothetical protein [Kutzneria sp. 744]|uniref:hypothetical protein n=1 Tax=Kutzneria sp. (strain 744) TaxID=345341 RepID=UPI0003EEC03B|nr:hypothetical protein [Kutzneria sp. 744]EWM19743.1 LigA protein [Kutzneria sp. 744]